MKLTNHQFFDFLDFDTNLPLEQGVSRLWKACKPIAIHQSGLAVVLTVPFQCQLLSNDIAPDTSVAQQTHKVYLRAFGSKILRVSIGFDKEIMQTSEMLQM